MNVGSLAVSLTANSAAYVQQLMKAGRQTKRFAKDVQQSKAVSVTSFAAIGAGVAAMAASLFAALRSIGGFRTGIVNAMKSADDLGTAMSRVGASAEELTLLQFAAQRTDVALENMISGLDRLNRVAGQAASGDKTAAAIVEGMGVGAKEFAKAGLSQKLAIVSGYLDRMPNAAARTAAEFDLLGRGAGNFGELLSRGPGYMKAIADEASRLGVIIPSDTIETINRANDAWDRMTMAAKSLFSYIAEAFAPTLEGIWNQLASIFGWLNNNSRAVVAYIQGAIAKTITVVGYIAAAIAVAVAWNKLLWAAAIAGAARLFRAVVIGLSYVVGAVDAILRSPIGEVVVMVIQHVMLVGRMIYEITAFVIGAINAIASEVGRIASYVGEVFGTLFQTMYDKLATVLPNGFYEGMLAAIKSIAGPLGTLFEYIADKWKGMTGGAELADQLGLQDLQDKLAGLGKEFAEGADKNFMAALDNFGGALDKMMSGGYGPDINKWIQDGMGSFMDLGKIPGLDGAEGLGTDKAGPGEMAGGKSMQTQLAGVIERIGTMSLRGLSMGGTSPEEKMVSEQKTTNKLLTGIARKSGVAVMG